MMYRYIVVKEDKCLDCILDVFEVFDSIDKALALQAVLISNGPAWKDRDYSIQVKTIP